MRSGALEDFVDGIECEEGDEEEVVEGGPNSGLDALVHRYAAELCADRKEGDSEALTWGIAMKVRMWAVLLPQRHLLSSLLSAWPTLVSSAPFP